MRSSLHCFLSISKRLSIRLDSHHSLKTALNATKMPSECQRSNLNPHLNLSAAAGRADHTLPRNILFPWPQRPPLPASSATTPPWRSAPRRRRGLSLLHAHCLKSSQGVTGLSFPPPAHTALPRSRSYLQLPTGHSSWIPTGQLAAAHLVTCPAFVHCASH